MAGTGGGKQSVTVATFMIREPERLKASDTVASAVEKLMSGGYMALPVVDAEERLAGMFSMFSVFRLVLPRVAMLDNVMPDLSFVHDTVDDLRQRFKDLKDQPVGAYCQPLGPVVHPETDITQALLLLYRSHGNLPVVDARTHRLVGVVSHRDAMTLVAKA